MSDDVEVKEDQPDEDQNHAAAGTGQPPVADNDDCVEAQWVVTVDPEKNVSVHFTVRPKSPEDCITSASVSLVQLDDGMVTHSYAGGSMRELIEPRDGQGMTGDVGADVAVFAGHFKGIYALLTGQVRNAGEPRDFFFKKPVTLQY